MGINLKKL